MTDIFDRDFDTTTRTAPAFFRPATERQLSFVESLREQYDTLRAEIAQLEGTEVRPVNWGELPESIDAASESITKGKLAVSQLRDRRNALREATAVEPVEGGFYLVNYSGDNPQLYMVKVGGSGHPYAMTWSTEEDRWIYIPGGMNHIQSAGREATREDVASFGRTHGYCMVCGRLLTNPESVAAGIGPICAERF